MSRNARDLTPADAPALRELFCSMPAQDRTFFFQDVNDPAVAERWTGDSAAVPRGVFGDDGRLLAFAALRPGIDWSSHVAEVVLVVAPDARRSGVGRTLAHEMLLAALERRFRKVSVTIPADNVAAIAMFQKLGFDGEALLRDQLCSPEDGELRDVVILSHLVDDTWSTILSGGYEEAVG